MIKLTRWMLVGVLTLAAAGCATTQGGSGGSATTSSRALMAEQLEEYPGYTLLAVIQSERPTWLRQRGRGSLNMSEHVRVYVNGMQRGSPRVLDGLRPVDVARVEYLNSQEATARLGTGHPNGAIMVTMK